MYILWTFTVRDIHHQRQHNHTHTSTKGNCRFTNTISRPQCSVTRSIVHLVVCQVGKFGNNLNELGWEICQSGGFYNLSSGCFRQITQIYQPILLSVYSVSQDIMEHIFPPNIAHIVYKQDDNVDQPECASVKYWVR